MRLYNYNSKTRGYPGFLNYIYTTLLEHFLNGTDRLRFPPAPRLPAFAAEAAASAE
jgi:hypothetical protein